MKLCAIIVFENFSGRYEDRMPNEVEEARLLDFLYAIQDHNDFRNPDTFIPNVSFLYQLAFAYVETSPDMQTQFLENLSQFSFKKTIWEIDELEKDEKSFFYSQLNKHGSFKD